MKRFLGLILILSLISLPVLADTVEGSMSFEPTSKVNLNLSVPAFIPSPVVNLNIQSTSSTKELIDAFFIEAIVFGAFYFVISQGYLDDLIDNFNPGQNEKIF